jgi:carbonic anhydrase/acetyltransferase-like protein (isoleucine patch superfamily)
MIHAFEGHEPEIAAGVFVAWNAEVLGSVSLAEGSSVWFGSTLRGDIGQIRVGRLSNIQDNCALHVTQEHPCLLGERVTVGHGAILHGCTIGDGSLIGMGAVVLDGAEIGEGCIVGAGSLVTQGKRFPPHSLIMGSPAKVSRELSAEEVSGLREHAGRYAIFAKRASEGLRELPRQA